MALAPGPPRGLPQHLPAQLFVAVCSLTVAQMNGVVQRVDEVAGCGKMPRSAWWRAQLSCVFTSLEALTEPRPQWSSASAAFFRILRATRSVEVFGGHTVGFAFTTIFTALRASEGVVAEDAV